MSPKVSCRSHVQRQTGRLVLGLGVIAALLAGCGAEPERIVFDAPTTTNPASLPDATTDTDPSPTSSSTSASTTSVPPTGNATETTVTDEPSTPDAQPAEVATIAWNGNDGYLHGANLPWINFGCDFGCGQQGGVSSELARAAATNALNRASDAGMSTVRWWLFPDIRPHVTLDAGGLPTGFQPAVYEDIDVALELAAVADIDLVFTIFAGPLEIPPEWLADPSARVRFVDVLDDLFVRYANHPRIMTWQIMNEPEWAIWNGLVDAELVRDLVREVAERVRASTSALVSIGSARMDGLPFWTDLGLDYLTVHWYDNMTNPAQCVPCAPYGDLARSLDTSLPILIGEFHHNALDPVERLERFRDLGYAGALAWSLLPDRTADGLDIVDTASREFAAGLGQ